MSTKSTCLVVLLCAAIGCERVNQTGSTTSSGGGTAGEKSPSFEYAKTGGCARFHVYRTNQDQTEVFVVSADADNMRIKEGITEFDLATKPKGLTVTVESYPKPQKHLHHCQDFTDPESDKPEIWTAMSGRVSIERFPPEMKPEAGPPIFRVKVTVTDAEFQDASGRKAKCQKPVVLDTNVGWFAG
jgi:quinol monooxygenase YgiN